MKKVLSKILLSFLAFFTILGVASAASVDPDYKIKGVYMDVTVDSVGSFHVKEAIIVKGAINGFELGINYKNTGLADWEKGNIDFSNSSIYNAKGVSLSKTSAFSTSEDKIDWELLDTDMTAFEEKATATKGDNGVYFISQNNSDIKVRTFNVNESGYMVYYYDYYIDNAVVVHNDVAELYWNFLPKDFDDVENFNLQLTIPGTCTDETFRMWAKGPLSGEISGISTEKDDDGNYLYRGVLATVPEVKSGEGVTIRLTFDKSIVAFGTSAGYLNESGEDALTKIEAVEQEWVDASNDKRKMIKVMYYGSIITFAVSIIGIIITWIVVYNKYDKERKVNFDAKYYREFTGDYGVEVIDYLMNKSISTNAMSASIMNLIYKNNITVDATDKKNVKLRLNSRDNVSEAEGILLSLLFDKIGSNNIVVLKDIKKYSRDYTTAETFLAEYRSWESAVTAAAKREDFFENKTEPKVIGVVVLFAALILGYVIANTNSAGYIFAAILIGLAFIFMIYCIMIKKWTIKGREHYLKWKAFKNFLNDFGSFADKEVIEIKLWEKYLVYATVFGLAKKVQNAMKIRLTEVDSAADMPSYSFIYYDTYIGDDINDTVSYAHTNSASVVSLHEINSSVANSKSSTNGFGGGFTGGGGAGGGGGSGHGF